MSVTYDDLLKLISSGSHYNIDKIKKAYDYADALHCGQKRNSGEPYIVHPISVAIIIAELQLDTDSICAALLHDVLEDCHDKTNIDKLSKEFGSDVANIVDGVTKLVELPYMDKQQENIENLRKMFLAMSKDLRVIFVKLADRLHNMRTLKYKSEDRQRAIALETMHVYAPLAHRLGLHLIKQELEDLSLQYLDNIAYQQVKQHIQKRFGETKDFLEIAKKQVAEHLESYHLKFKLEGRIKTIYSIYKKMYNQKKQFDEIYDFYAIRIIVDTELDCYTALGIIHEAYNSIPGRFKDYISTPKPNNYRSLHTTVIGKQGVPFEVQIRTWEMHRVAEYGLAAHWKYKSGETAEQSLDEKLYWIRTLIETEKDVDEPDEFFRPLKIDLFQDETFVFTPKGDVINLSGDATPIDFAYAIHSAVGNKMIGAKVNGVIVPIDTKLESGQIVEILTSASSKGPSRDWLKIVHTAEARNKIRQFFKKERRPENIAIGKMEVDRELKRYGRSYTEAQKAEIVRNVAARMGLSDPDDLYNNLGYGGFSISKLAPKLKDEFERIVAPAPEPEQKTKTPETQNKAERKHTDSQSVIIDSVDNCEVKFAKCCNPLPGDSIIGFITKGHGVSIHKYDCPKAIAGMQSLEEKDRWIVASWASKSQSEKFEAVINVYCKKTNNLFFDISSAFNALNVEVVSVKIIYNQGGALVVACIKTSDISQLAFIMQNLKKYKFVEEVKRAI